MNGTLDPTYVLNVAIMCHQANKVFCSLNGDDSQEDWYEAEEWQKESAIKGVEFRLMNPNAGHDDQHNSWMKEKINDGWVYNEIGDAEEKTHPGLIPFNELPYFQQQKYSLFCGIVDALAPRGFKKCNLNFGKAIDALKAGKKVARAGWNGKGMFLFLLPAGTIPKEYVKDPALKSVLDQVEGDHFEALGSIRMWTADKKILTGWLASQTDMLAEDWIVLE